MQLLVDLLESTFRLFYSSLQSRKKLNGRSYFSPEKEKSGSRTVAKPPESPKKPLFHLYMPDFRPKIKEKRLLPW